MYLRTLNLQIYLTLWACKSLLETRADSEKNKFSPSLNDYRRILFSCTPLYCASQILHFLQIEGLWQPFMEQVYQCHCSNSICSICISSSHFGNSHSSSNPPPAKRLRLAEGSDDSQHFLAIEYFLIKVRTLFFQT